MYRIFSLALLAGLCLVNFCNANPIVELQQVEVLPEENIAVEVIEEKDDDVPSRNARQFNFGVGFGYGGNGGYQGGYGGYNNYGGYPHNHNHGYNGYGQGYYAPSYGHYHGHYPNYYNNHNGFDHHHHGYDHHHHHHGHFRRAFGDEFVPELLPNYLPQKPYVTYADPPRGILVPKPIQNEVQIPVSVLSDPPAHHIISPIKIPLKQDEVYKPEFINEEPLTQEDLYEKENITETKIPKDEKTEKEPCTCKNNKEKSEPTKKV